ncbi:MAG: hypothetical protein COV74_03205 [Candidatus Omnitrophica bacterium CG11_big_fil_rev_8_21_14_0_20_45_26]|uniref:Methyltransferase n=1 Tax=Candidatus Abzuiibacterium crystallinum TaxID=1974748 RepID=A0A2H0LQY2_9BACT|nr:MAG: hypothetical protein COV74_03205 [Candidatus Omnitrophica bacterium CG11_big_fil_rev_8_21_14_0_20_45_26]PIW64683.1 MAG: hypothetical protein COW12_05230 [Candidatus Omnitrophica bacterium CG12_big_fil_rev_8_21_14_0_65_45_16]
MSRIISQIHQDLIDFIKRLCVRGTPMPRFGLRQVVPSLLAKNRDHRFDFFSWTANYLSANYIDGVYVEFGCCGAVTMRYALNTLGKPAAYGLRNHISHFFAFDSFEGLPEASGLDRQKCFSKGKFSMSEEAFKRLMRRDLYRVTTIKGFYQDTLPHYEWQEKNGIALAYFDCDYYESTKNALEFIKDKMNHGAVIAFDDWQMYYGDPKRGQKKAMTEFREQYQKTIYLEPFFPFPPLGMSFIYLKKELMGSPLE